MTTWTPILDGYGGVDTSDGLEGHFFLNAGSNTPHGPPPDTWTLIDLTQFGIPSDAKSIDVSGVLTITMGNQAGFANLCVTFRKPGASGVSIRGSYSMQCIANTGDGMRSTAATVLTPVNGLIEWGWWHSGADLGWPLGCSLGVNLTITRWMK